MSWRRRVRGALDGLAAAAGVLRALERRRGDQPLVLMHHRVLPRASAQDYPLASLALDLELFEAELAWLGERFELRTLEQAFGAAPRSRPVAAMTFDDGYADNAESVAPLLERCGARGTFFVAADFVAGRARLWYDRAVAALERMAPEQRAREARRLCARAAATAAEQIASCVEALKRASAHEREARIASWEGAEPPQDARFAPMSVAQVRALAQAGHEIGGHSLSHALLPQCDDGELARELELSRRELEQWCARPVTSLAYPDGAHDERVVAAARRAGFTLACTTRAPARGARPDRMRIGRIDVTATRIATGAGRFDALALRAELAGLHEALR